MVRIATPSFNSTMRASFKRVGVPLWVPPLEAADFLRREGWAGPIALELAEWFARLWSMAFASGYLRLSPYEVPSDHVLRLLVRMKYHPVIAAELSTLLLGAMPGMYRKGCQRRSVPP